VVHLNGKVKTEASEQPLPLTVFLAKRGRKTRRVRGVCAEIRLAFPQRVYRRRALVETLFSSVKRKLSARVPGQTIRTQMRQALLLALSFNLYRLRHPCLLVRMSTEQDSSTSRFSNSSRARKWRAN
jgi:hypothetical protein